MPTSQRLLSVLQTPALVGGVAAGYGGSFFYPLPEDATLPPLLAVVCLSFLVTRFLTLVTPTNWSVVKTTTLTLGLSSLLLFLGGESFFGRVSSTFNLPEWTPTGIVGGLLFGLELYLLFGHFNPWNRQIFPKDKLPIPDLSSELNIQVTSEGWFIRTFTGFYQLTLPVFPPSRTEAIFQALAGTQGEISSTPNGLVLTLKVKKRGIRFLTEWSARKDTFDHLGEIHRSLRNVLRFVTSGND